MYIIPIYFQPHGQVQAEANARLIAAAPDGYELAKLVQAGLWDDAMVKAREFIRKVEGIDANSKR